MLEIIKNIYSYFFPNSTSRFFFLKSQICYAAKRSIYFASDGTLYPCCFNRAYSYGKYPEEQIQSIISGNKIKFLRTQLKNNNFSHGCNYCEEIINKGSFMLSGSRTYDAFRFPERNFPVLMEFELSHFCNLNCIMCPSMLHTSSQQTLYDENFIDDIKPLLKNLKNAKFFGGEPFLIKIYYSIWKTLIKINPTCKIQIQTNGTILDDRIKKLLDSGNFQIMLSIDTFNPETYEKIRLGAQFDKMKSNLDYFLSYSKKHSYPLHFSTCPMIQNAYDIPDIIKFCMDNEISLNFNTVTDPPGCTLRNLSSEELIKLNLNYSSCNFKAKNHIQKQTLLQFDSLKNLISQWLIFAKEREKIPFIEIKKTEIQKHFYQLVPSEMNQYISLINEIFLTFPDTIHIRESDYQGILEITTDELMNYFALKNKNELIVKLNDIIKFGFR